MLTVIHVLAGTLLLIDLSEAIRRRGLAHAIAFVIALMLVAAMQIFVLGMNAR
jgi:preprotein translocase subunit SecY